MAAKKKKITKRLPRKEVLKAARQPMTPEAGKPPSEPHTVSARWEKPKEWDKNDRRCGLTEEDDDPHELTNGDDDWCSGCHFYVCDACSKNLDLPFGGHDIMDHKEGGEEGEDPFDED